jgi:hypothetical protein
MLKAWGLLAVSLITTGCVTTIQTHRYGDKLESGVLYYLPKTLLALHITYTVIDKVQYRSGAPDARTRSIFIEKPILLETRLQPDARYPLVIDPAVASDAALLETKFGFRVGDNGLLLSVDSTFKDRSGDFVQQLVGAAVATAKLVASAVAGPPDKLQLRIATLSKEISATDAERDPVKRLATVQTLQKELNTLLAITGSLLAANRLEEQRSEVSQDLLLDPETFTAATAPGGTSTWYEHEIVPENLFRTADGRQNIAAGDLPKIKVSIKLATQDFTRPLTPPLATESVPGVVYRSPVPVETRLEVNTGGERREVGSAYLAMAQFGRRAVAVLRSKRAGEREVHATFGPGGGLTEYRVDSGSSADQLLQKVTSSVDVLQKTIGELRFGIPTDTAEARTARDQAKFEQQAQSETLALRRETEALKAQLANEQARAELKKLQDAGAGARSPDR